eukprot:6491238-Amphidinium_carterae.1
MVYEKARFARVRAYNPSIHRHDPMFPRCFGAFNEDPVGAEGDERPCWEYSPHEAGDNFTLQVENYNINYSRKPIFAAQRGMEVPRYICDPCVSDVVDRDDQRTYRMTDDDARHATPFVLSTRTTQVAFSPPGALGDSQARQRVAIEVFNAEDSEIRIKGHRPLKRRWKCCCCPYEFRTGEEDDAIHFCSFDGCQHVMCIEHAHAVGLRRVTWPGKPDLIFPHYFCWRHKQSDMWNRRVTYFKETNAAQYRRLRRISDRYPPTVNIFQGVEESVLSPFKGTPIDHDEDIHVDIISQHVLQGHDPEGRTLLPPTMRVSGTRSNLTCYACRVGDTHHKYLQPCWHKDPKCKNYFCEEHCRVVGFHNFAGLNIQWCLQHDNELLPLDLPDWQRQLPDSDGEYPLDATRDEITWDARERQRRRLLPENLHEGSSDSQGEEQMMTGRIDADSDQSGPSTRSDRPGRDPNARSSRSESALVAVRSIPSGRVERFSRGTETVDEFELKMPGTGFTEHLTRRCITCRLGAPEGLKIYWCQVQGCPWYTCVRCAVPLQLVQCRQGLVCHRHFPHPRFVPDDPEIADFLDNHPYSNHWTFKEI